MITTILNIVIPFLAFVSLIAVVFFFGRAFTLKMQASKQTYGVGQFEKTREMKLDVMRGVGAAILGLIFLAAFGIMPRSSETVSESAETPVPAMTATLVITPSPTVTAIVIPTMEPGTAVIFPTSTPDSVIAPDDSPTAIPTIAPATATAAPAVKTAVVASGVGVWLRDAPTVNSNQLEWLLEGVILTVLDGQQTADELDWQEVRTSDGVEGWVASDYIEINE
jgi:hypothetical protein